MAHTFDIRLANGAGLLSIDAQGVSIAVKRSLVSLLARHRSQRIPAEDIREVFREGEVLRVEFATRENARASLPFRARDRATAAQIVQLLPTSRTIEVEDDPREPPRENSSVRPGWRLAAAMALVVAFGMLFINTRRAPVVDDVTAPVPALPPMDAEHAAGQNRTPLPVASVPGEAAERAVQPLPISRPTGVPLTPEQARRAAVSRGAPGAAPAADGRASARPRGPGAVLPAAAGQDAETLATPVSGSQVEPGHAVLPIPRGTPTYDTAIRLFTNFEDTAWQYREEFRQNLVQFHAGDLDKRAFVQRLRSFEDRWVRIHEQLRENVEWQDGSLVRLRARLLEVTELQMRAFDDYATGLNASEQSLVDQAFEGLARADEILAGVRKFAT